MAAIDFPSNPLVGQLLTVEGRSWIWSGTTWDSVAGAGTGGGASMKDALIAAWWLGNN
jgi:hypothetical protein